MRCYVFLLLFSAYFSQIKGQVYQWTGATDTTFSDPSNWSGNILPPNDGTDSLLFDASAANCFLDGGISVKSISITSSYSGLINCDVVDITVNGDFNMDGGTFYNTSDLSTGLKVSGNFIQTGGTFIDHGGKISLYMSQNQTYTFSANNASVSLIYLDSPAGASATRTISLSGVTTSSFAQNNAGVLAFQGSIDVTSSFSLNAGRISSVTPAGNTGTINFTGSGPIIVKGVSLTKRFFGKLPNININTTGNITFSNCLNVDGNWTHNSGTVLAIPASSIYLSGSSASISGSAINGNNVNFNNLIIPSSGNITLPTTNSLMVANSFSVDGTLANGSLAGVVFSGTNSILTGTLTLNAIAINNNGTLTISSPLSVLEDVDIRGGASLNTGGNLTLESTALKKARIDSLNGGALNGNIKVNSYIPGPTTGWALIGAPVQNMVVLDLENSFFITCTGCTYDPTVVPGGFYSVQGWDGDDFITAGINSTTPLTPGLAYWVYIGDGASTTNDLMFYSNTNAPVTGNYSVNVAAGTGAGPYSTSFYGLAANPYPSPIDHDALAFSNQGVLASVQGSIYDADANGGAGGWVTVPFGSNYSYPIAQGVCLEFSAGGNQTLVFDETMKVSSNSSIIKAAPKIPQFALQVSKAAGYSDKTYFMFSDMSAYGADKLDLHKIKSEVNKSTNSLPQRTDISSYWLGEEMAVLSLPVLTSSISIPLHCKFRSTGSCTINLTDLKLYNGCVILHDKKLNAFTNMKLNNYVFNVQDLNDSARFELVLFEDENAHSTAIAEMSTIDLTKIASTEDGVLLFTQFQNPTAVEIDAYNVVGQKIMSTLQMQLEKGSVKLPIETDDKIIIVKIKADNESISKKVILH
jgi:hypothetical protein